MTFKCLIDTCAPQKNLQILNRWSQPLAKRGVGTKYEKVGPTEPLCLNQARKKYAGIPYEAFFCE